MELTPELKKRIDMMSYEKLLQHNRFAPIGDPMFQGNSGEYFLARMSKLRSEPGGDERHVAASKAIGWGSY